MSTTVIISMLFKPAMSIWTRWSQNSLPGGHQNHGEQKR